MARALLAILLLLALPVYAAVPGAQNFGSTCRKGGAFCYGIPLAPVRFFDFTTQILPDGFTFTRASAANYFNSSGVLVSATNNAPRFDYGVSGSTTLYGLLLEGASTNTLLFSRDLTNPAWLQTTVTVLLDQTGIDNAGNSASSMTALGPNSTVCQGITQAATFTTFSVFLKRISGSGAVAISQDNGATYTTITLTSSWQRFIHSVQSTLNPGACIRLATSGDEIAVDVAQMETNNLPGASTHGYASSPIITTSAAVTRSADILSMPAVSPTGITDATGRWFNKNSGAFVLEWQQQPTNSGMQLVVFSSAGMGAQINNGNIGVPYNNGQNCGNTTSFSPSSVEKTGATYGSAFFASSTNSTHCLPTSANPSGGGTLTFGSIGTMWLRKFTYWNYPLTTAQLQARTL